MAPRQNYLYFLLDEVKSMFDSFGPPDKLEAYDEMWFEFNKKLKIALILTFEIILPFLYLIVLVVLWSSLELHKKANKEIAVTSDSLLIAFSLYFTMIEDFYIWVIAVRIFWPKSHNDTIVAHILKP